MDVSEFESLLERLTGTNVKDLSEVDRVNLAGALGDETRIVDASQFNELMLLANKDRVEAAFFKFFFADAEASTCSVAGLRKGVERFQRFALLSYGNFIYAFRVLARAASESDIRKLIGEPARDPDSLEASIQARPQKILRITAIDRDKTYLVGYLSTREIAADLERAKWLHEHCESTDSAGKILQQTIAESPISADQRTVMGRTISRIAQQYAMGGHAAVPEALKEGLERLQSRWQELKSVQETAQKNTNVYLTWDHMDIYFATSMRKRWEYEDLHGFVDTLMHHPTLTPLRLRYFDPTQSYDTNRVNKGLVEALMLKRAAVTVYSIQDTDTLGKDSELAATLAQGKPVIAYAPRIDLEGRASELYEQRPLDLRDRLQFVFYADEACRAELRSQVVERFLTAVADYESRLPWLSMPDDDTRLEFQKANDDTLKDICAFLAAGESRITESRARTLRVSHPLGIQVNLATGVANGVLVVRSIPDCAELIRRVVTNRMEFDVKDDTEHNAWTLREKTSDCVYRVVSRDRKLTNCFWNFYRHPAHTQFPT